MIETVDADAVAGWEEPASPAARALGDAWLGSARSAALSVPALPSRPIGRIVMINPVHPAAARIARWKSFSVPWDERLFGG